MHVIDISNPEHMNFKASVDGVLEQLGVLVKPTILVLNKTDQVADQSVIEDMTRRFNNAVAVSAREKFNLGALLGRIEAALAERLTSIDVMVPLNRMDLIHLAHREGDVLVEEYTSADVHLRAVIPVVLRPSFE